MEDNGTPWWSGDVSIKPSLPCVLQDEIKSPRNKPQEACLMTSPTMAPGWASEHPFQAWSHLHPHEGEKFVHLEGFYPRADNLRCFTGARVYFCTQQ